MSILTTIGNGAARAFGFSSVTGPVIGEYWAPSMSGVLYPSSTGFIGNASRGARFGSYITNPSAFPQNNIWQFGCIRESSAKGIAGNIARFSASNATKYSVRTNYIFSYSQANNNSNSKVSVGDLKVGPSTAQVDLFYYGQGYFDYSSGYGSLMFWYTTQTDSNSYSTIPVDSVGDLSNLTPLMAVTLANGAMAITSNNSMNVYGGKPTSQTSMEYFRVKFTTPNRGITTNKKINFVSGTTSDTGGSGFACSYLQSDTNIYLICGMVRSAKKGISIVKYNTTNDTITWAREVTNSSYDLDSFALWTTPASQSTQLICQANYGCVDENGNLYVATCVKYAAGNYRPIIFKFDSNGNLLSQWEYNRFASGSASNQSWAVGSLVYNQQTSSLWMLCINPSNNFAYVARVAATTGNYISELQFNAYTTTATPGGYPSGNIDVNNSGEYIVYSGNYIPSTSTVFPASTFQLTKTDGTSVGTRNYSTVVTNLGNWDSYYYLPASGNYWNVNTSSTIGTSTTQTYTVTSGTYYSTGSGLGGTNSVNLGAVYS